MDKNQSIAELASGGFAPFSACESDLLEAIRLGKMADCSGPTPESNDLSNAEKWGSERTVRAALLTWLCTDRAAAEHMSHRGLVLLGARIEGHPDLSFASLAFPLKIRRSFLPKGIDLSNAQVRGLYLSESRTGPIDASGAKIEGDVFLRNGHALGEVNLVAAQIGGDLEANEARFINPDGASLNANHAKVEGVIFLNESYSEGEVNLVAARIAGDLEADGARFINPKGRTLDVSGARVGSLSIKEIHSAGEVRLVRTTINGSFDADGAQLINPSGDAIDADGLTVTGDVFLRNEFSAKGRVSLIHLAAGSLHWGAASSRNDPPGQKLMLDLRLARVRVLRDDKDSWPDSGHLRLDGFTYEQLHDKAPRDAKSRLAWLELQPDGAFRPQPYEQLAGVLQRSGHAEDAEQILMARERELARGTSRTWFLVGWLIGYGYAPLRAFWLGLGIVGLGACLFQRGKRDGLLVDTPGAPQAHFNALVYSVDLFTPLIDLYQADHFCPDPTKGRRLCKVSSGALLRVYFWLHIAAGWFLSTLLAIGLSGIIRD